VPVGEIVKWWKCASNDDNCIGLPFIDLEPLNEFIEKVEDLSSKYPAVQNDPQYQDENKFNAFEPPLVI